MLDKLDVAFLIHANTPVPVEKTQTFYTLYDSQRAVDIQVMEQAGQEESPELENNTELTRGKIVLPPGLPASSPIQDTFSLAADGTLKVRAVALATGGECNLEVQVQGVMSDAEVEQTKRMLLMKNVN